MTDETFGHINYEEGVGWTGEFPLEFGGTWHNLLLLAQVDEDEGTDITEAQRQALQCFDDKWDSVEPLLVDALIQYYNNEEKYSYGPENEEEAALWWPDINTHEELYNAVTPATVVIPPDYLMESGRRVYLLLDRTWGGEDLDDNGVGVCFINEQIAEIGYKDIAF
jgi:hypothetical protein